MIAFGKFAVALLTTALALPGIAAGQGRKTSTARTSEATHPEPFVGWQKGHLVYFENGRTHKLAALEKDSSCLPLVVGGAVVYLDKRNLKQVDLNTRKRGTLQEGLLTRRYSQCAGLSYNRVNSQIEVEVVDPESYEENETFDHWYNDKKVVAIALEAAGAKTVPGKKQCEWVDDLGSEASKRATLDVVEDKTDNKAWQVKLVLPGGETRNIDTVRVDIPEEVSAFEEANSSWECRWQKGGELAVCIHYYGFGESADVVMYWLEESNGRATRVSSGSVIGGPILELQPSPGECWIAPRFDDSGPAKVLGPGTSPDIEFLDWVPRPVVSPERPQDNAASAPDMSGKWRFIQFWRQGDGVGRLTGDVEIDRLNNRYDLLLKWRRGQTQKSAGAAAYYAGGYFVVIGESKPVPTTIYGKGPVEDCLLGAAFWVSKATAKSSGMLLCRPGAAPPEGVTKGWNYWKVISMLSDYLSSASDYGNVPGLVDNLRSWLEVMDVVPLWPSESAMSLHSGTKLSREFPYFVSGRLLVRARPLTSASKAQVQRTAAKGLEIILSAGQGIRSHGPVSGILTYAGEEADREFALARLESRGNKLIATDEVPLSRRTVSGRNGWVWLALDQPIGKGNWVLYDRNVALEGTLKEQDVFLLANESLEPPGLARLERIDVPDKASSSTLASRTETDEAAAQSQPVRRVAPTHRQSTYKGAEVDAIEVDLLASHSGLELVFVADSEVVVTDLGGNLLASVNDVPYSSDEPVIVMPAELGEARYDRQRKRFVVGVMFEALPQEGKCDIFNADCFEYKGIVICRQR